MKKGYSKAALFLASQAVSLLGSFIVQFAIISYVTLETESGGWVAMISAAAYIPQFLISFFAGVWADRYPRKRLIIAADGAIALATWRWCFCFHKSPKTKRSMLLWWRFLSSDPLAQASTHLQSMQRCRSLLQKST